MRPAASSVPQLLRVGLPGGARCQCPVVQCTFTPARDWEMGDIVSGNLFAARSSSHRPRQSLGHPLFSIFFHQGSSVNILSLKPWFRTKHRLMIYHLLLFTSESDSFPGCSCPSVLRLQWFLRQRSVRLRNGLWLLSLLRCYRAIAHLSASRVAHQSAATAVGSLYIKNRAYGSSYASGLQKSESEEITTERV